MYLKTHLKVLLKTYLKKHRTNTLLTQKKPGLRYQTAARAFILSLINLKATD